MSARKVTVWCPYPGCPRNCKNDHDSTMHPDTVSIELLCPWHARPGDFEEVIERDATGKVVHL